MIGISVVIPLYNAEATIEGTVQSALDQLQPQDEIIIINDGSTDESRRRLAAQLEHPQVHYQYQDNAGVSAARNRGIDEAAGEYVLFLDSDDRLLPGALERFRRHIEQHPDQVLVSAGHVSVDATGRERKHRQPPFSTDRQMNFVDYVLKKAFSIPNGAVCIRRKALAQWRFPPELPVSEDFCLYAWLLANHDCGSFAEPTVEVLKHEGSLRNQLAKYEQALRVLPDLLFDPARLPEALLKHREEFVCNRLLSLFRAQFQAGEKDRARETYEKAIKCRKLNVMKLSYLRKYMRLLFSPEDEENSGDRSSG